MNLSDIVNHFVNIHVSDLKELADMVPTLEEDAVDVKDHFHDMAVIWRKLKPAEDVARALFPALIPLFDVLDNVVAMEDKINSFVAQQPK